MVATLTSVLAAIGWDPEIRNILGVAVGVVVLVGSVYLLVGSNVGLRTGLLITLAGLFGWMATMGGIWWIYGIGLQGPIASWRVEELNYSSEGHSGLEVAQLQRAHALANIDTLPSAQELLAEDPSIIDEILPPDLTPEVREQRAANIGLGQIIEVRPELVDELGITETLDGWQLLEASNRTRGDAIAAADAYVGPNGRALFESSADYIILDAYSIGGRRQLTDDSLVNRVWYKIEQATIKHRSPTQYAVVQLQAVLPRCADGESAESGDCFVADPNAAAPVPDRLEDQPIVSVILVRDLGRQRVPAIILTIVSTIIFLLLVNTLHRRDKAITAARAGA